MLVRIEYFVSDYWYRFATEAPTLEEALLAFCRARRARPREPISIVVASLRTTPTPQEDPKPSKIPEPSRRSVVIGTSEPLGTEMGRPAPPGGGSGYVSGHQSGHLPSPAQEAGPSEAYQDGLPKVLKRWGGYERATYKHTKALVLGAALKKGGRRTALTGFSSAHA